MSQQPTLVREVMTADPLVVSPEQTLGQAWAMMSEQSCRHLPVLENGHLVGVISMVDIGRVAVGVESLMARSVGETMTKNPVTVGPDEPIESAAAHMGLHKVNCLPVVSGGKLVGIVTTYDLLDALARHLGPRSVR